MDGVIPEVCAYLCCICTCWLLAWNPCICTQKPWVLEPKSNALIHLNHHVCACKYVRTTGRRPANTHCFWSAPASKRARNVVLWSKQIVRNSWCAPLSWVSRTDLRSFGERLRWGRDMVRWFTVPRGCDAREIILGAQSTFSAAALWFSRGWAVLIRRLSEQSS